MNNLITKEEVAVHYKVSSQTVLRWVREGRLRGVKVAGKILFEKEMIQGITGFGKDPVKNNPKA